MEKTALQLLMALAVFCPTGLSAAAAAAKAAELGKSLTPLGAERKGNADGSIPAWEGGMKPGAFPHVKNGHYSDPFKTDKPLFTITSANIEKYKDQLTPGQLAMFAQYKGYKMVVYPTRRTASFPDLYYKRTLENAKKATLAKDGNGVLNATDGVPFPIPQNGLEAIWNGLLPFRGAPHRAYYMDAPVLRNGSYTPNRSIVDFQSHYNGLEKPLSDRSPNRLFDFFQTYVAPARFAGTLLLVQDPLDQVKESRTSWLYNPGQRRVRLAPTVAYDNPPPTAEGLRTYDDYNMYNGSPDRYDWKLVGKKELFVPYNSYRLSEPALRYKDILKPGHLNQDYARYEKHRVWVVEGTLKKGVRHIYRKRVFYLDEDSWIPLVSDKYDGAGKLWHLAEQHVSNFHDIPLMWKTVLTHNDLTSGRYLAMNLTNEERSPREDRRFPSSYFTPANLRGKGTR